MPMWGKSAITLTPSSGNVNERSNCYVSISYLDVNGVAQIPAAVSWRLWDDTNKIQIQDWTPISTPAKTNTFEIPSSLNELTNEENLSEVRLLIFKITGNDGTTFRDYKFFSLLSMPSLLITEVDIITDSGLILETDSGLRIVPNVSPPYIQTSSGTQILTDAGTPITVDSN